MEFRELAVPGAIEFTPKVFPDDRGVFLCPYQEDQFVKAVGHSFHIAQSNHSLSKRGTLRGMHFADVPPGQAKYVYCPQGALLDVIVDLRVGSPTFGTWDAVQLDPVDFRAVYVPEGLAHGIIALTDDTVASYLCSTGYDPGAEHGINPLDPSLGLPWPADLEPLLSPKDRAAPNLSTAGPLLPTYADCLARYASLDRTRPGP